MGMQLLLLLLKLCILHGSAGTISSSPAILSAAPIEGGPVIDQHQNSLRKSSPSTSPLPDGYVLDSPTLSATHKFEPAPQTIKVAPSMPLSPSIVDSTHKLPPLSGKVPELVPSMPQSVPSEGKQDFQQPTTVPHAQEPVASPPREDSEMPLPVHPSEPGVSPTVSGAPPVSLPSPNTSRKKYRIPVAAPPVETPNERSSVNHPPSKEHLLSPTASSPKMNSEKPVAVHPSKPGIAPSTAPEHVVHPISAPPSRTRKDNGIPAAAPPKEIIHRLPPVNHPPVKEHAASPKSTPPSRNWKKNVVPTSPPRKERPHQLSPTSHSPAKEHAEPPKSTPYPRTSRKDRGTPVAAPPKEAFHLFSPVNHRPVKEHAVSPISTPPSTNMKQDAIPIPPPQKEVFHQLAPTSHSPPEVPIVPAAPHPPKAMLNKSHVIPLAPLHPPTVAPKKSTLRHRHPQPMIHGLISPAQPSLPPTVTFNSPAPSEPSTTSSTRANRHVLRPPSISPKASPHPRTPKKLLPPPTQMLPPPPPNQDCSSFTCSEPYTNSPPGAPCDCVLPIKVGLRLGVALYTFFPRVTELAEEIASEVFMKQSQVRIMGANAATQQLELTDVLIDLVPLGEKFDNNTAFLIYEKFWNKQVTIKTSFFGDYEVLYVSYSGLPTSPPSAASSITIINGVPYAQGNNARTMHPLGVDVGRKHEGGLSGSIIAVIALSSFAALVLCIGAAWLLLLKCGDQSYLVAKTPRTSMPSHTKQSGAAGSTLFGSGISSTSLSFGSSITTYTGTAKTFSADEIERATNNFEESRMVGEGGFGRVYRGILEDGKEVAVKVLKRDDQQGAREFLAEVEMLSRLHHRNLVKLIGICIADHSRCLVYELIPNGSVESHLHGVDKETTPLDLGARLKIALGSARGLAYLHEDSTPHVIHRDFKSSNILLEHDYTPKVSDFGLARAASDEGNKHISTRVMGTFGYVAPEYAMTGHLLVKSDVYSYGVVLLELLTGRKPVDMSQPEGQENLVAWARPLLASKEGLEMILDPALRSSCPFDSVGKVAAIASMCVQPEVSHRPFMGEVVQALKLVCNECDDTKAGSESCSQEYGSVVDIQTRTSTSSGHLVGTSHSHALGSDYGSSPEVGGALSASDIFTSPRRFWRQSSDSFRRHSSSGPLSSGRNRQFWQKVRGLRGLSRGSVSEHGFAYRLWGESR